MQVQNIVTELNKRRPEDKDENFVEVGPTSEEALQVILLANAKLAEKMEEAGMGKVRAAHITPNSETLNKGIAEGRSREDLADEMVEHVFAIMASETLPVNTEEHGFF